MQAYMQQLVHQFIGAAAARTPHAEALVAGAERLDYAALAARVAEGAQRLLGCGLLAGERVAVYLDKRSDTVAALFGASMAGGVMVPINPLLKAEQVAYILADCNVRILVTSPERLPALLPLLADCPDLRTVLVTAEAAADSSAALCVQPWRHASTVDHAPHRRIDADVAAILYTSGSTGKPKGVVLSHRNMVAGALSVSAYLDIVAADRILAVLPLSFDYGLSQLTCAFHAGATVVLINHLFARDVLAMCTRERITGLAAVPPLWNQLVQLTWPPDSTLRYLTNSGGALPLPTVAALRAALPAARLFLMYGLTEAFRSTYLPPEQLDARPASMGRAIPNAEVMVVRPDGSMCDAGEAGELVHRGALVSLGYWNDPVKTAERFRPAPGQDAALPLKEMAVWSGDTVYRDSEGYLYFVGRGDDMIKVSGYRVSPSEVEEVAHAAAALLEVAAFGVPHAQLGQAIVLLALVAEDNALSAAQLAAECKRRLPAWMAPAHVELVAAPLPRNPNGKIDRKALQQSYSSLFESVPQP